ncbi:hypothetical protein [Actinomyces radicidentis]|uniref:hypothetical protein n=1 Tax=Actinomyces radicidentis TaxID=111015 RepID=UPI0026DF7D71|nr:hypothetical protein [Actinomyces radicidentis]
MSAAASTATTTSTETPSRRRARTAPVRRTAGAPTARARRPRARREASESEQPQLYVVRGLAPARSTLPFILLIVAILIGALATSMVLNARMAGTAYKMQKAQIELNVVNDHIDTVQGQVLDESSPEQLAQRAAALGMVPAQAPGVVDLTSSTVSGGTAAWSE